MHSHTFRAPSALERRATSEYVQCPIESIAHDCTWRERSLHTHTAHTVLAIRLRVSLVVVMLVGSRWLDGQRPHMCVCAVCVQCLAPFGAKFMAHSCANDTTTTHATTEGLNCLRAPPRPGDICCWWARSGALTLISSKRVARVAHVHFGGNCDASSLIFVGHLPFRCGILWPRAAGTNTL